MNLECLRCKQPMEYLGEKKLQLGNVQAKYLTHYHSLEGGLEVHLYRCPSCGKLEFFDLNSTPSQTEEEETTEEPIYVKCPRCQEIHELGLEKCTCCDLEYNEDNSPIWLNS